MFNTSCGKCNGTGRVWATHVQGGICFSCGGCGYHEVKTDPAILADRRAAAKAKRETAAAATVEFNRAACAAREAKYANDPRIGPETRARIVNFPLVGFEAYRLLSLVDEGKSLPHILVNLAR